MKTILCIPGNWQNRSEIVTAIASANINEFIFAGNILYNLKTQTGFELAIQERDENMRQSFHYAGMVNRVSNDFLNAIDEHTFVIYVIGDGGSFENAKAMAEAGLAILKAGGTGIKVETSGKGFIPEHWAALVNDYEDANLYEMFVLDSISDGEGTTWTCGMHNLGLKDAVVSGEEFSFAFELLSTFGYYQVIEKPSLQSNQTFSTAIDAPVFKITDEQIQPYANDELFGNPFGLWRLERS